MRLVLAEPKLLKDSIAIISELVNEVIFKIDKEKIEMIAMDPANVAMMIFKLFSSAFVEYNVEENLELAISLDNLNQVLKRAKPSDTLVLESDTEKNKLRVQLKGESTRTFDLALIDLDTGEQKIPNLNFSAKVEMPTVIFDEAIEDVGVIAESVALAVESNKFIVESEGRMNAAKIVITGDEETAIKLGAKKNIVAKYSIEYLKKMIKGSRLAGTVKLEFDNDYPLALEYKIVDKLMLRFILAPRTDAD